jgi:uncharacterized protein (TIGR02996 family)
MAREIDFLHDICDNVDDDAPRLIFADWLDDQGQEERARFIRLQIERAKVPRWERRWLELEQQEEPLEKAAEKAHARYRPRRLDFDDWQRGFPTTVSVQQVGLLPLDRGATKLFATTPIRAARLFLTRSDHRALAEKPWLARLARLELLGNRPLDEPGVNALAASRFNQRLCELSFSALHSITHAGVTSLLRSPLLPRLRKLKFTWVSVSRAVAAALASTEGAVLEELELYSAGLSYRHLEQLAGSPALRGLRVLRVGGNGLERRGLAALLRGLAGAPLEELDL